MPALSRTTGIAAVALVAAVGAGGVMYLASNSTGGAGSRPSPASTPAPTAVPTPAPTAAAALRPSPETPGITAWKTYTSSVYGYTISYPDDWSAYRPATVKWEPGAPEDGAWADLFTNPEAVDGESIGMFALQIPAPAGADLESWDGLQAALKAMCAKPGEFAYEPCPRDEPLIRLCGGSEGCQAVLLARAADVEASPRAVFGDPATGIVTLLSIGRPDDYPAAARYGGTVKLLQSVLSQMGVREAQPGETPN